MSELRLGNLESLDMDNLARMAQGHPKLIQAVERIGELARAEMLDYEAL